MCTTYEKSFRGEFYPFFPSIFNQKWPFHPLKLELKLPSSEICRFERISETPIFLYMYWSFWLIKSRPIDSRSNPDTFLQFDVVDYRYILAIKCLCSWWIKCSTLNASQALTFNDTIKIKACIESWEIVLSEYSNISRTSLVQIYVHVARKLNLNIFFTQNLKFWSADPPKIPQNEHYLFWP